MIHVDFLCTEEGYVTGFRVEGHADMGKAGQDIVCAAVSSAVYMAANTITDVLSVTPISLRVNEGDMLFRVEDRDEQRVRSILSGLKLHLLGLEEQYPKHISVNYTEI